MQEIANRNLKELIRLLREEKCRFKRDIKLESLLPSLVKKQ